MISGNEIIIRSHEIIIRSHEIIVRSLEVIIRSQEIIIRSLEIIFRGNKIILRGNEIEFLFFSHYVPSFFSLCPFRASVVYRYYSTISQLSSAGFVLRLVIVRKKMKIKCSIHTSQRALYSINIIK